MDSNHYKQLMDGLEAMEINLSVCKEIIDFRIDASTYKKEYVRTDELLQNLKVERIERNIKSIQNFGAYSLCNFINFTDDGIPFLMTQNVRHNYIDWNNIRYVDDVSHKMLYKSHCKRNQVLVTMAGEYLGRVAVYDRDYISSSNQAIAKLTLIDDLSPYYVSTFLNSKYGQNQINRFKTITGQPNINMTLIKYLQIPKFSSKLYNIIESIVSSSNQKYELANNKYDEAEQLFIDKIGFKKYKETNEINSIKSFSESFKISGRLDAEYYQKKFDDLYAKLKTFNCEKLIKLVKINKSIEPGSDMYSDEGIPFVRVSDTSKYGLIPPKIMLPTNVVPNPKILYPKQDTILLTKDGSVGVAYKVEQNSEFITSSALLHLSVIDKNKVNPDYLALVLNSIIVQLQAEQCAGGSIIQHWKPSEIKEVLIPILEKGIQDKIALIVQNSFALRKESQKMLEFAQRIVEIAVEQGESEAIKDYERAK